MTEPHFNIFIAVITGNASKEQVEACETITATNIKSKVLYSSLQEFYNNKPSLPQPQFNSIDAWKKLVNRLTEF